MKLGIGAEGRRFFKCRCLQETNKYHTNDLYVVYFSYFFVNSKHLDQCISSIFYL